MKGKEDDIDSNFKEKIEEFYRSLNMLEYQQPSNKQINRLYFQEIFANQDEQIIEKITPIMSKYCNRSTEVFIKIVGSIQKNNFIINEKELKIITQKPNTLSTQKLFEERFKVSFEENVLDSLEIKLLKSLVTQDQQTFKELIISEKLYPQMKNHVIGFCKSMAAACRDINLIKFFICNDIDVNQYSYFESDGKLDTGSLLRLSVGNGFCTSKYFPEELVDLLLATGVDVNMKDEWDTPYFCIIQHAPEGFTIKLLDKVTNVNETELGQIYDLNNEPKKCVSNSYLTKALRVKKYELAKALIAKDADVNFCDENGGNVWDIIRHFSRKSEIARLIVAKGKLKLRENENKSSLEYYNKIKAQVDFEEKCQKDIEWLDSKVVGKWSNLLQMLKYYTKTYKEKLKDCLAIDTEGVLDQNATKVIDKLKTLMIEAWPDSLNICKYKDIPYRYKTENKGSIKILPKNLIKEIGAQLYQYEYDKIIIGELPPMAEDN